MNESLTIKHSKPLIIYHAGCPDGFCAAWVANMYFRQIRGTDAELHPGRYEDPPPDVSGRDVLIVDFSYPRDILIEMYKMANSLRVFDHHKTSQADLASLTWCVFDMNESGATLTWRELFTDPPLAVVRYVRDRDLWKWELPNSKEVSAYIMSLPHDIKVWDEIFNKITVEEMIKLGTACRQVVNHFIDMQIKNAYKLNLFGIDWIAVNTPQSNVADVLGALVAQHKLPALGWSVFNDGVVGLSLRSADDLPMDVSVVAKSLGGGGHRNAAGCRWPKEKIDLLLPNITWYKEDNK